MGPPSEDDGKAGMMRRNVVAPRLRWGRRARTTEISEALPAYREGLLQWGRRPRTTESG